ncbi:MAG: type VII toxin-antitoxin system HepT family RNase toxin [Roseiflexus sp.]
MVRPEVIRKRLEKLDEYLAILRHLQRYSYDEFVDNPERYGSAERFLQPAIESINDLGNHIVAESGLGNVDWYSDIPRRLREGGLIDTSQEETWIKMIGFHNILVHDYLKVDRSIVFRVLQENIDDLETFKRMFAQFL